MDFEEIAVLVNQVAVERKGRPLKDVERLVLKGSWENKTYSAMATPTAGYTEDYLKKDVGPKLWQLLTDLVDDDIQGMRVTKRNIQNVLQTWVAQSFAAPEAPEEPAVPPAPINLSNGAFQSPSLVVRDLPRIDLADCGGREAELADLTELIVGNALGEGHCQPCRTVVLWGLPGIGKTALVAAIAATLASQVDRCGYLALTAEATDQAVIGAIAQWLDLAIDPAALAPLATVDRLLDQLAAHRALLVIDGMEQLFAEQQLAGSYRPGTDAIQYLFHQGAERHHRSCLVWVSREKPADFAQVQGPRVRDYALDDLAMDAAVCLLRGPKGLHPSSDDWAALVKRYGSHPLVLRGVGAILGDVYQGQPQALLPVGKLAVPVAVHRTFAPALERLLPEEWAMLYWLALAQEPLTLDDLNAAMQPPAPEDVVQSVLSRGWVQGIHAPGQGLVLSLKPVVQALVLERLQAVLTAELEAETLDWLQRLPLVTMTAREVVQELQRAAMLAPLGDELRRRHPTVERLADKGDHLLRALRPLRGQAGYGAGNIIHLFQYLGLSLSGVDFSHLAIWQGDLRRVSLQGTNFSQAQFDDTAFATALGRDPVAAFSPDGSQLAAGDHEGRLLLWNLHRGKLEWMFDEGQGICALDFSPQGDLLAVGTENGQIWLWPVGATYQTDVLEAHQAPVGALAFSPDGSQLASGDDSGQLCLWEVASGFKQGTLASHGGRIHSLAYDKTGGQLVSGGDDQRACLWQIADRTLLKYFQVRSTASLRTAGFLPDSNDPSCQPIPFAAGYDDRCLTIWNLVTGLPCWILPAAVQALPAMAVSPSGRYLVCSCQDFSVALWDIPSRRQVHTLPSTGAPVWTLAFSADSRYFVTGSDYTIKLWHAKRGQCWRSFLSQAHPMRCLAFSAASGTILTGHADTHLRLWQVAAGSPYALGPRTLEGHGSSVRAVALSPVRAASPEGFGQWLASSADDQTLRLWSTATGQSQWVWATPSPAALLCFSPDGQWLASGSADGISVWSTATGKAVGELECPVDGPCALAFSLDGDWIVAGGRDGVISLWRRDQRRRAYTLPGHQGQVHSLALGLDRLASASHDGTVCWWSLNGGVHGLSTEENRPLGQWRHPSEQWLQGVTLNPAGDILAVTSTEAQVEVWDVATNQRRHTLQGHSQAIWQIAVCPSCTHLITASHDDEIRVWELDTGLCQQTLRPDRPYEGVNIREASGLSDTEERMLKSLGAIVSY